MTNLNKGTSSWRGALRSQRTAGESEKKYEKIQNKTPEDTVKIIIVYYTDKTLVVKSKKSRNKIKKY